MKFRHVSESRRQIKLDPVFGALEMSCRFLTLLTVNHGKDFTKHYGELPVPWLFSLHLGLGVLVVLFWGFFFFALEGKPSFKQQ